MLLVFTFTMSATVISKIIFFFLDRQETSDKKTVIVVSVYEMWDKPFGAFSKIVSNSIPY